MPPITPEQRTAPAGARTTSGPVTLMNRFAVTPDRDDAFLEIWTQTSRYFTEQPGFLSLRLHRAVSDQTDYRWVNVASWESEAQFRAAHGTEEFRRIVTQDGWAEFASQPALFEVITAVG